MSIDIVLVGGREYRVAPLDPPKASHPDTGFFAITPAVAERWLQRNRSNRNLRKIALDRQARDIATGRWDINGETIKISRPLLMGEVPDIPVGDVLFMDGQHRLEACIESGTPFVTAVVWGLEPESRLTVDDGSARKMGDVLTMEGKSYGTVVATLLRRQMMWNLGDRRFNGPYKPTKAEMMAFLKTDEHAFMLAAKEAWWVREKLRTIGPTVVAQAYYLTNKVSHEEAPWFFARLRDGADLSVGHPVLTLRERLAKDRYDKKVAIPHQQLAYVIRAWNAYRTGVDLKAINQPPDAPTPDPK